MTNCIPLNFFREAKQRKEVSKPTDRERYRGDRNRRDDRKRDRDERKTKERSPDRYDRHNARSHDKSGYSTYRSDRDTGEEKWKRRGEDGRDRSRNETNPFLRPTDSDNR